MDVIIKNYSNWIIIIRSCRDRISMLNITVAVQWTIGASFKCLAKQEYQYHKKFMNYFIRNLVSLFCYLNCFEKVFATNYFK